MVGIVAGNRPRPTLGAEGHRLQQLAVFGPAFDQRSVPLRVGPLKGWAKRQDVREVGRAVRLLVPPPLLRLVSLADLILDLPLPSLAFVAQYG